ncbi:type VI secretion protein IcmF [Candidatus Magnetomorum sp. HK-1]|nr:type VI secretion protein IcmF [Candidatus Magnetomorum sp. HK-1]
MSAKLVTDVFNSGATRMFGGALCGGLIVIMIMRLFRNYGTEVAIICLIGMLIAALIIIFIYYLYKNYEAHRQQKLDAELEKKAIEKQRKDRLEKNVASLKSNWQQAMEDLKRSSINIYDLPWFMMIGEPQSGKTTLLRESRLKRSTGNFKVDGAGGTENCNWWFFDDAVLLDTAGRFSMPVTNLPDQDEWIKFLDILVKSRPRCPVNGVIVAIPMTSLLEDSENEIQRKAKNIQNKLLELTERLGVVFPVFLMVTKMDILRGFTEFCFTLKGEEDTQIFGWNREEPLSKPYDFQEFEQQFYIQTQRLFYWSLRILKKMPPDGEIEAIYSFSQKFSQIRKPLHRYCEIIFENHKMKTPLSWRGTFFSSGVQKGKEFINGLGKFVDKGFQDQIKQNMKTKPYFIYNFCKKMFIEKGLVKPTKKRSIRQRNIQLTAAVVTVLFLFASILMLVPGYRKLKDQVFAIHEPLQYSNLFIHAKDNDINIKNELPDIVRHTKKMHQTIMAINEKGATKRFLHGSENELYEGLKGIETAMLVKGLYRPFFRDAAEMLSNISIQKVDMRDTVRPALRQLLLVLAGQPLEDDAWFVLFEIFPDNHYWKKYRQSFHEYLNVYNENSDSTAIIKDLPLFKTFLKDGFEGLSKYWSRYPDEQLKIINNRVKNVAHSYSEIVKLNPQIISSNIKIKLDDFYEKAMMLIGQSDIHTLTTPKDVETACINDYEYLLIDIKDSIDQMMRDLHKKGLNQCSETRQEIERMKDMSMSVYGHLILPNGQVNPELKNIINIIQKLRDMGELFTEQNRQIISVQESDFVKVMDKQYAQWKEKQQKMNGIVLKELGAIKSKGWEEERLKQIFEHAVAAQIQLASQNSAKYAVNFILQDTLKKERLIHGDLTPSLAQPEYLLKQFQELKNIENWAYTKNVPLTEAQSLSDEIRKKMTDAYANYIQFWSNTIKYDPVSKFRHISTWEKFRNTLSQEQGIIIDPSSYPLNLFLENVSEKEINDLQDKIGHDRGAISTQERNVLKCARTYGGPLRGDLEKAHESFFEKVENISMEMDQMENDNLAEIKAQLKRHKNSLNVFNTFIRASGQESLSTQLRFVQNKAARLLKKNIKQIDTKIHVMEEKEKRKLQDKWQSVKNKWEEALKHWDNRFGNLYPFKPVSSKTEQPLNMKNTIDIQTLRIKDLQSVFFHTNKGLQTLVSLINQERNVNSMANDAEVEEEIFIEKSNAWKNFLFDKSGKPKNHIIKIILENSPEAAKKFTRLDIEGLETTDGKSKAKFRFSGTKYNKKEVTWNVSFKPIIRIKATNEETYKSSECVITGGDLSLLGFLSNYGRESNALYTTDEWIVEINLPYQSFLGKKSVPVFLKFKWDEPIPDVVHFP